MVLSPHEEHADFHGMYNAYEKNHPITSYVLYSAIGTLVTLTQLYLSSSGEEKGGGRTINMTVVYIACMSSLNFFCSPSPHYYYVRTHNIPIILDKGRDHSPNVLWTEVHWTETLVVLDVQVTALLEQETCNHHIWLKVETNVVSVQLGVNLNED